MTADCIHKPQARQIISRVVTSKMS